MLLIKNGKILTMAGLTLESGSILIKDKKIAEVGKDININPGEITETIDAEGLWVLPGLIEAHCHVGITEEKKDFEGDDCNEMRDPITPYIRGVDAINPMDSAFHNAICSGITSVMTGPGSSNVVGGQFAFIKTNGRSIDNMLVLEPAAMKIAFGENPKSNYNDLEKIPTSRMTIAALLREELFKAKQYLKEKEDSEKAGKPFELNFRRECWLPVLNKKIPLKAHAHRADDILTAIRIAREFDVNLTLDHCTEGYLIGEIIKESTFPVILGPCLTSRRKIEVQNMDFKNAGILYKKGIKIALTTDHPVTRIQYLPICAGFAVKEGLPMEEGFKAITINAAEICNVSDRVGSIEVGKDADIAIFDGNPMEVFTNTIYTIIDGQIIYDKFKSKNKVTNDCIAH
ncbi:amidohydrolase [Clostridium aminobutyricum]|uniref:Amidohydrolase n=1 Tax=Clostridium aminobutyricum TaxID=33953 RepID=A0A939D6W4_CLOAM|nr:amidohydrolase [Clostridium aminobutyricum]MBN7772176.1 amidohydrolase [Clostridium aminobutyricum]